MIVVTVCASCSNIKQYHVTFKDYDGTVLVERTVKEGTTAALPETPERTGYTFTGWDKPNTNITENTVITAMYQIKQFVVTFKDYDGQVLDEKIVNYGESANSPIIPTHSDRVFREWNKDFSEVKENLIVIALYDLFQYDVTFKDYDGTVLKTGKVDYGTSVVAPSDPSRTGYTFTGWDKTFDNITENTVVTAIYQINKFDVTFKDHDGTVLKTGKVNYGTSAVAPSAPSRTGYTFTGWNKTFDNITENIVITATYEIIRLTIKFINFDNSVLQETAVDYGTLPLYLGPTPTAVDDDYIMTFTNWDNEIVVATTDQVYKAQYSQVYKDVDIWDGSVATSFGGGDGTINNPYLIKTCAQLAYLGYVFEKTPVSYRGTYYKMTRDLDLNNLLWSPIGRQISSESTRNDFQGTFDGNNYAVTNLNVTPTAFDYSSSGVNATSRISGGLF